MIKLLNEEKHNINIMDMKDGDIAIITKWNCPGITNRVVQRYGYSLISLGLESGQSWTNFFNRATTNFELSCEVKVLEKGTTLVIE